MSAPVINGRKAPPLTWVHDDGGRELAGFRGDAGDCVTRSIAIALNLDYRFVYDHFAYSMAEMGKPRSARNGIPRKLYDAFLEAEGWVWTPTMAIGSGCTVHLRWDELPEGDIICRLTRHLTAVCDGVIHDTHDPSRGGTRCVYGYWQRGES